MRLISIFEFVGSIMLASPELVMFSMWPLFLHTRIRDKRGGGNDWRQPSQDRQSCRGKNPPYLHLPRALLGIATLNGRLQRAQATFQAGGAAVTLEGAEPKMRKPISPTSPPTLFYLLWQSLVEAARRLENTTSCYKKKKKWHQKHTGTQAWSPIAHLNPLLG